MDADRYQQFVSLLMEAKPPDVERVTVEGHPELPGLIVVHVEAHGRHAIQGITGFPISREASLPAVVAEVWRRLSRPQP